MFPLMQRNAPYTSIDFNGMNDRAYDMKQYFTVSMLKKKGYEKLPFRKQWPIPFIRMSNMNRLVNAAIKALRLACRTCSSRVPIVTYNIWIPLVDADLTPVCGQLIGLDLVCPVGGMNPLM